MPRNSRAAINRRTQSVAKRVKRVEGLLKDKAQEKKCVEVNSSITTLTSSAVAGVLLSVAQGDSDDQHIGNSFFLQDWVWKLNIRWARETANWQAHVVRVIIGLVRYNGAGINASNIATELFGSATPAVDAMYALARDGGLLGRKFIIVKDRMIKKTEPINVYSANIGYTVFHSTPGNKFVTFKGSYKNNKAVMDDNISTTNPVKQRPFILFITDSPAGTAAGGGNEVTVYYQGRHFFTENKAL